MLNQWHHGHFSQEMSGAMDSLYSIALHSNKQKRSPQFGWYVDISEFLYPSSYLVFSAFMIYGDSRIADGIS